MPFFVKNLSKMSEKFVNLQNSIVKILKMNYNSKYKLCKINNMTSGTI